MSAVHQMTIGEPFNPRYEACGVHPEETVSRRRDLTDGQKRLYDRMVRWARAHGGGRPNERAGELWRSHENMAAELGKSERQVRRDLTRLESVGLIKHRIRDGRKSNTYVFLFHPWFERTSTSGQTQPTEPERPLAHPRPVKPDLSGHPRPANQKVFNQKVESSSSSSQGNGRLREQRAQSEPERTTKKTLFEFERQSPSARPWWTPEDLGKAAGIIGEFTGPFSSFGYVDVGTVLAIISNMESIPDLRLWLASSTAILKTAKTWGRYVADAKHWPARRVATVEQVQRAMASLPTCEHGVKPADRCGTCAQERERARQAQQAAAERARAPKPPTAEEIAARAERRRELERRERVHDRWQAFWEKQPLKIRQVLNRMTLEKMKNGASLLGETLREKEAALDSLENGTHPVFQAKVA